MITEIKLNESQSVWKTKYNWECSKESFLNRIDDIKKFKQHFELEIEGKKIVDEKYFYFLFDCIEFRSINDFAIKCASAILQQPIREWSLENWLYVVNNDSRDLELNNKIQNNKLERKWHTHPDVYVDFPIIESDFTFVFYIQMPDELNGIEGNIGFKTNDGIETFVLPEEGDFLIFPGTLLHTPVGLLTPKNKERLLIAGNISLNPLKKFKEKKLM